MKPVATTPHRTRFLRLTLVLTLTLAFAAPPTFAADPAELYARGKAAFDRHEPDYVAALRYLAAYRETAGDALARDADFRRSLDRAIDHAAAQLDLALRTKRELDKHGEVREVTFETRGKLDRPGDDTIEVRVRLPRGQVPPKPTLASRPPAPPKAPARGADAPLAVKVRPAEPVRPTRPQAVDTGCAARLDACQEKAAAESRRLAHCVQKLEAVADEGAADSSAAIAGCRKRLDAVTERYEDLELRFDGLRLRYRDLAERCSSP